MQLQCFFLCVLASPYLCNCKLLARHLLGVFLQFFLLSVWGTFPICCVLELKHALCCLLELKSLTRVVPQCFNGFIDFAMVFMFLMVVAKIYLVFIHFSTTFMDF